MAEWSVAPGYDRGPNYRCVAHGDCDYFYDKATGVFLGMRKAGGRFVASWRLRGMRIRVSWPVQQWQRV